MSLQSNNTTNSGKLYMAIDLSSKKWKLCFGMSNGSGKRLRTFDALDLKALVDEIRLAKEKLLFRHDSGKKEVCVVCHIPTEFEEDKRRVNRERDRLQKEKNAHSNQITSLLIRQGIKLRSFTGFREVLPWLSNYFLALTA